MLSKTMRATLAALTLGSALVGVSSPPASAAELPVVVLKSGTGTTLRMVLFEHYNGDGKQILIYGSGPCSATTYDADYSLTQMPAGWNDQVSSFVDYASCDLKIYWNTGFRSPATAHLDGGGKVTNVPKSWVRDWNDQMSSFQIS